MYLTTSCVLTCILAPQMYLAFKHKKLCTLVTAMALQRLPDIEAISAFEIPNIKEAKLICHSSNNYHHIRCCCIPVQSMQ